MNSGDEMLGLETGEDDYHSDGTDGYNDEEEPDYEFVEEEDSDIIASHGFKVNYVALKKEDIRKLQEDDIVRVSTVLSVTENEAVVLLLHYHWNVSKIDDAWFADEERVRTTVGILKKPVVPKPNGRRACVICFDTFCPEEFLSVSCGHPYCSDCWKSYIRISINDGPGCLLLKCPEPSCSASVSRDMVEKLLSEEEEKKKFYTFLLRSYVEGSKKMKWCPAPGCENAVDFAVGSGSYDVSCLCSHRFCWNCIEEAHRPVDCETVGKWIQKNSAEAENTNWLLANTKPCPKCKRAIEKNSGCMHMTCGAPCKFHFCWLCLGDWASHGEKTGGYYSCNRYEVAKRNGEYDADENKREMAKNSLERYTHYYERWLSNHKSRLKSIVDLEKFQSEDIQKLSDKLYTPETQLKFIADAWVQIIECRRVLKWTYAYGYYLSDQGKKAFFEYLQSEAESGLERLHSCVEKELIVFYDAEGPSQDFKEFQTKLTDLTAITKNFFANLVKALENGLSSS